MFFFLRAHILSMDVEILQKYKAGGSGEYVLVYKSEGKDDPFGDMTVQNAEELSNEIAINLAGEVTMAATMDDELGKLLDSYNGGETVTIAAYTKSGSYDTIQKEMAEEDEEEKDEVKL